MRKPLIGMFAVVALTIAARANATTINFDALADGTILAVGTFDGIGVHFDQRLEVDDGDTGILPQSLPNGALNFDQFGGNVTGTFVGPVSSVNFISVFAGDQGGDIDTVSLLAYNALNLLVGSATFTGASAQTLSVAGAGIVRFELLQVSLIGFDDFTFTPEDAAAVPEPSSILLFGTGAAAMVVAVRRRRKPQQVS